MAQGDVVVILGGGGVIGRTLAERCVARFVKYASGRTWLVADEESVRYLRGDVLNTRANA